MFCVQILITDSNSISTIQIPTGCGLPLNLMWLSPTQNHFDSPRNLTQLMQSKTKLQTVRTQIHANAVKAHQQSLQVWLREVSTFQISAALTQQCITGNIS